MSVSSLKAISIIVEHTEEHILRSLIVGLVFALGLRSRPLDRGLTGCLGWSTGCLLGSIARCLQRNLGQLIIKTREW